MIEISGFTFKYGTRVALDNVNMTFKKGEIAILAGANGAGKTTLLRAISGVLLCQRGKIRIDGVNVGAKSKLRRFGSIYSRKVLVRVVKNEQCKRQAF
ncbi:MAG: ABC transporter ATP-binding protein [Candidatus Aminicenantes bacterium]|jgi:ABC-type multidrug transport system ATPase subunit